MGMAILLAIFLITAISVGVFWAHVWWFPVNISTQRRWYRPSVHVDPHHYRDHFRPGPVGARDILSGNIATGRQSQGYLFTW